MLTVAWILLVASLFMFYVILNNDESLRKIYVDGWLFSAWIVTFALSAGIIFGGLRIWNVS